MENGYLPKEVIFRAMCCVIYGKTHYKAAYVALLWVAISFPRKQINLDVFPFSQRYQPRRSTPRISHVLCCANFNLDDTRDPFSCKLILPLLEEKGFLCL